MDLKLRVRGREVSLIIDTSGKTANVVVDGDSSTIEEFSVGERYVTLRIGGSEFRLPYAWAGTRLHIGHAGANYTFTSVDEDEESTSAASDGFVSEVISPMPGKVLAVMVSSGDTVEAGQAMLVLEAMKMEQTVRAPAAARVSEVKVDSGSMIGPGQTLLVLDPVAP